MFSALLQSEVAGTPATYTSWQYSLHTPNELLRQASPSLLDAKFVEPLLRRLHSYLGYPSRFLGLLKFCLQIQNLLFGHGHLYISVMEPFTLLLNLVLGILQVGLSALLPPFLSGQLRSKLLVLLLSGA